MPEIIIYYKSEKPAEIKDIYNACGIFKKINLSRPKMKDQAEKEAGLRKIIYEFPFDQHMPSNDDLDNIFSNIIEKCNIINIKSISCKDEYNHEYTVIVEDENE